MSLGRFSKRTVSTIILFIVVICLQLYEFLRSSISFINLPSYSKIAIGPESNLLFLALVVTLGLSVLWHAKKLAYMLFVAGQLCIIFAEYNPLNFSRNAVIGIQLLGMTQFVYASFRLIFFLFSSKGFEFIETRIYKKKNK